MGDRREKVGEWRATADRRAEQSRQGLGAGGSAPDVVDVGLAILGELSAIRAELRALAHLIDDVAHAS